MNAIIQGKDALQQMGDSAELFTFSTTSMTYYYTSYYEDINFGGNLYQAVPIKRSGFNVDVVEGVVRCQIQAPVSDLFSKYIITTPYIPITVDIKRFYLDDNTHYVSKFKGSVNSISIQRQVANVECLSSMDELHRKIPRIIIQSTCNNSLYSKYCGILMNNFKISAIVNPDTSGTILTIIGGTFSTYPLDYFINGIIKYNDDTRFICNQLVDTIEIYFPFYNLISGSTVLLYAGCDKKISTCKTKFNNEPNFLGMPFVKKTPNPVTQGI